MMTGIAKNLFGDLDRIESKGARKTVAMIAAVMMAASGAATAEAKTVSKKFNDPRVGGRWVDVCYAHGGCREQQAANTFCTMQGYEKATTYSSRVSKLGHQNVRIGDNSICTSLAGNCHRFTKITCQKTIAADPAPKPKPGATIDPGAALAIGAGAAIIGGIISQAGKNRNQEPVPEATGGGLSAEHIDWCYAKYQTYKASTNSYAGVDGKRHQCNSPYN